MTLIIFYNQNTCVSFKNKLLNEAENINNFAVGYNLFADDNKPKKIPFINVLETDMHMEFKKVNFELNDKQDVKRELSKFMPYEADFNSDNNYLDTTTQESYKIFLDNFNELFYILVDIVNSRYF